LIVRVDSFAELLRLYAEGERDFSESDLDTETGNLDGVCLDGIDLSRSFVFATFRNAKLRGARFWQANVKTCDFSGADLQDADFRGAALCSTSFQRANTQGAKFEGAYRHSYEYKAGEAPED
jgi:uncharacterized protein YjbI with pentapeptide repeats